MNFTESNYSKGNLSIFRSIFVFKIKLVDRLKSLALKNFHRTKWGEILILKLYLQSEEFAATNGNYAVQDVLDNAPSWLKHELTRHEYEEKRHVAILKNRIENEIGFIGVVPLFFFSNRKIKKFFDLGRKYESQFESGLLIPILVSGLIFENVGARVFKRHIVVLDQMNLNTNTKKILISICRDEKRHVFLFLKSIRKLIRKEEIESYRSLRREALQLERRGGLRSAFAMLFLSFLPPRLFFFYR